MFEFEEQHRMLEKMLRTFCEKEIQPHVEALESGEKLPFEFMTLMSKTFGMKSFNAGSSKEKGDKEASAPDVDPLFMLIVVKEISRVCPSLSMAIAGSVGLAGQTLMAKGTPAQKKKYGLPVMSMEKIACWGMTEPDSGSDAFALRTIAKPVDGGYVLNGSKIFITNAPYADIFIIYAKIDRGQEDKHDKRFVFPFVVEKGTKGLSVSKSAKKLGMRGSPNGEVFMDDMFVPLDQLLGETEDKSSRDQAKDVFTSEASGTPGMCWGMIERCLEDSIKFAIQRKQFGKEIARFQLIQEKIAKMHMNLEIVRNFAFKQAWAQKNKKGTIEDAAAAKYFCANAAVETGLMAIQLMGGYGYMQEYHVEMLMRDAKLMSIAGGTDEIQLLHIAKSLLKKHDFNISISEV